MMVMVSLRTLGLTLPISATCALGNTQGRGKFELYVCTLRPVVSNSRVENTLNGVLNGVLL